MAIEDNEDGRFSSSINQSPIPVLSLPFLSLSIDLFLLSLDTGNLLIIDPDNYF